MAEATEIAGVDVARLKAWMDAGNLGEGPIRQVQSLSGGTQNVMLRFRRGEQEFVLRRPPVSLRSNSNETMRREARILSALAQGKVPHPRLICACDDPEVLGACFYLMEPVEGFNAVVALPPLHAESPAMRRRMGFALVEGAAALSKVDYRAVGLEGFGNTVNYLPRQVDRWRRQLDGYSTHEDWPGPAGLPGIEAVGAYLEQAIPANFQAGIIHGDYSIGNVMYCNDGPELAAIIDWELSTLGDPLLDLGWIAATWRGAGGPELPVLRVEPFDGFPTIEELVAHYGECTGRDLGDFTWYAALACYKLGIILEGTFARACAGAAPMGTGLQLHDTAAKLIERAIHRIEYS